MNEQENINALIKFFDFIQQTIKDLAVNNLNIHMIPPRVITIPDNEKTEYVSHLRISNPNNSNSVKKLGFDIVDFIKEENLTTKINDYEITLFNKLCNFPELGDFVNIEISEKTSYEEMLSLLFRPYDKIYMKVNLEKELILNKTKEKTNKI